MKKHYFTFMQSLLDHGHAEVVPLDEVATTKPGWYLPHFGVYNPQKPNKVRVVYDAAAECGGVSLNSLLLPGPDLTNSLIGILLRFRESPVAFMADVEQMFYSFSVQENHRNYLKFLWYQDNNPGKDIVEYRMKVHIFGSTSSPAVATYGLRKTAEVEKANFGPDAADLVNRNFYVDDALKSVPTVEDAVDLLHRTQSMLSTANLRLHKIASNRQEVMEAFPSEDQASDLRDLDLSKDAVPVQRSLGVSWDLKTDDFTFKVSTEVEEKPFTRRGVLSVVNSLYDPLGLVAPVVIRGKAFLRAMTSNLKPQDWDEPLPKEYKKAWEAWRSSLDGLTDLKVQRSYTSKALTTATRKEIHTFGDASSDSIAAVSYLRVVWPNGHVDVSFILGKAKLAPTRATTIPRLELCAAVLATEITLLITEELDVCPDSVTYYTDSRVVLGYLSNETRRFYVYVSNRVEQIRKSSTPEQWRYVSTNLNPADVATRPIEAGSLPNTIWHSGPDFLHMHDLQADTQLKRMVQQIPDDDPEVRPQVQVLATEVGSKQADLGTGRFTRFSGWPSLVRAVSKIITVARLWHKDTNVQTQKTSSKARTMEKASITIFRNIQQESYKEEMQCLSTGKKLPRNSTLLKLNPTISADGLLVVGGPRLDKATDLTDEECHPIILPSSHHATILLVKHLHRKCKKLRGQVQQQLMADLPAERLTPSPPFTYVGLDVFGPWEVVARRTRVIESMDTSCFINAMRRFLALRGPAIQLRSDRGSNFVGAFNELQKGQAVKAVHDYLATENFAAKYLTHEVLTTLMAEISAIVNGRPLVPVSCDPTAPEVLTPSTILTLKPRTLKAAPGDFDTADGKVRKVELMTATEGTQRVYTRPITEVVLLKTRRDLELGQMLGYGMMIARRYGHWTARNVYRSYFPLIRKRLYYGSLGYLWCLQDRWDTCGGVYRIVGLPVVSTGSLGYLWCAYRIDGLPVLPIGSLGYLWSLQDRWGYLWCLQGSLGYLCCLY
ncbi:hypothetical protein QZH41_005772 [Actinostola sp. cb2023]|nr:hypothetical protein QZH41_005772 [Actinostola sp. cb2023]